MSICLISSSSTFLSQHPGGEEVLLDEGAKDATAAFEDVGHTDDARDLLVKYYIGEVDPNVSVFRADVRNKIEI